MVTAVFLIMGYLFCSTSGVFCGLCDKNVGQMIEATILVDQGEYKITEFSLFGLVHVIRTFLVFCVPSFFSKTSQVKLIISFLCD